MTQIAFCFVDEVTSTHSTLPPGYFVGMKRYEGGKIYELTQADDALTANHFLKLDHAASATGKKVTGGTAIGDELFGVAESAVTDEYYFWMVKEGLASVLVADGTVAGDLLRPSATAGVLEKTTNTVCQAPAVAKALAANSTGSPAAKNVLLLPRPILGGNKIERYTWAVNGGTALSDGTTYKVGVPIARAAVLTKVSICCTTKIGAGTNTVKVLKGSSSGNTMLSAATFDPAGAGVTVNTTTDIALTSTGADLIIPASGASSMIYLELVAGTQSTAGVGYSISLEYRVTDLG